MAKPPTKRRGISLDTRADTATPLDEMSFQTGEFPPAPVTAGGAGATSSEAPELLAELHRLGAEFEDRWRHQQKQLQQQLEHLELQREQIAEQTRQLQSLRQARRSSARMGVLLTALVVAGLSALGFHTWPRLQAHAGKVTSVNADVSRIRPELQALHGRLDDLDQDIGQMGEAVASLRAEVTEVRSDLGSLRIAVDAPATNANAVASESGPGLQVAHTLPREAALARDPYRRMYPARRW